jgi:hypothetical protein
MSNREQINLASAGEKGSREAPLTDVLEEGIAFQLLQGLARIEQRLAAIEGRLGGGGVVRKVADKPNIRNMLIGQLQKGWISEQEAIERTGWQTIGVRSFVTKLRGLGLSVETEERDGVPHYRIAK